MKSDPRSAAPALLLAVLALVVAGIWWTSDRDAGAAVEQDEREAVEERAPTELAEPETVKPAPLESPEPRREPVVVEPHAPPLRPALPSVAGTFAVTDALGKLHEGEDGTVRLEIGGRQVISVVRAGTWSAPARPGESVSIVRAFLGDRPVFLDAGSQELTIPAMGTLDLLGHWDPPVEVVVLDAETGAHLPGVELFEARGEPGDTFIPDTTDLPSRAGLTSPITLTPIEPLDRSTVRHYWIRAPGYAWGSVVVDFSRGIGARVRLPPGGDLRVLVRGHDPGWSFLVSLRCEGEMEPLAERWDVPPEGAIELRGVPAGTWNASLELRLSGVIDFLDAQRVELPAGGSALVQLDANLAAAGLGVPLAGVLVPALGADASTYTVEVLSAGGIQGVTTPIVSLSGSDLAPVEGGLGELAWDAGLLTPGPYWIRVLPSFDELAVDLVPPGRTDVRLAPRETALVTLRVVDVRTGSDLDVGPLQLDWQGEPGGPDELTFMEERARNELRRASHRAVMVERSQETGRYEFVAPLGMLRITSPETEVAITASRDLSDVSPNVVNHSVLVRTYVYVRPFENAYTLEVGPLREGGPWMQVKNVVRDEQGD